MSISAVVDATKTALQSAPEQAQANFEAHHSLVGPYEVTVRVGSGHEFTVDEPEALGGGNVAANRDLTERFYSGKTRALHATHLSTGDRLWSTFPRLRPMVTITHDTLDWYGWDEDGASAPLRGPASRS